MNKQCATSSLLEPQNNRLSSSTTSSPSYSQPKRPSKQQPTCLSRLLSSGDIPSPSVPLVTLSLSPHRSSSFLSSYVLSYLLYTSLSLVFFFYILYYDYCSFSIAFVERKLPNQREGRGFTKKETYYSPKYSYTSV